MRAGGWGGQVGGGTCGPGGLAACDMLGWRQHGAVQLCVWPNVPGSCVVAAKQQHGAELQPGARYRPGLALTTSWLTPPHLTSPSLPLHPFFLVRSFGTAQIFGENLVGSMDRSYLLRGPAFMRGRDGPVQVGVSSGTLGALDLHGQQQSGQAMGPRGCLQLVALLRWLAVLRGTASSRTQREARLL